MKKMSYVRGISLLLVFLMLIGNTGTGICFAETAETEETDEVSWVGYINGDILGSEVNQGDTLQITVPVTSNFYQNVKKVKIELKDAPLSIEDSPKLYQADSDKVATSIDSKNYEIRFSVKASETSTAGIYHLGITFVNGDIALKSYTLNDTIPLTIIAVNKTVADMNIENLEYPTKLAYKEKGNITFDLTNTGGQDAENVSIAYEGFEDTGVLPNNAGSVKKIGIAKKDCRIKCSIPIKGSANAESGSQKLKISISYRNTSSTTVYSTEYQVFYIITTAKKETVTKAPKLLISNVKQTPVSPQAGSTVSLAFTVTNAGDKIAKNITITPKYLTDAYLAALNNEPYIFIKRLNIGASEAFTLNFHISQKAKSEMSAVQMDFALKDSAGKEYSDSTKLYVTGIQVQDNSDSTIPKVIIEDYDTSKDIIKAGEDFELTLDILNTNNSVAASDVKVNLTSSDSAFSMAKGSDNFYIAKIEPGQIIKKKLKLTAKADAVTKSYPLAVEFSYDYVDKSGSTSVTAAKDVTETISLQIEENPNPVLSNIMPGGYDKMIVGESNIVNFDFTNQGKSPIYNADIQITGDFDPTQKTYFVGTVESGKGKTYEMEITPLVSGTAEGLITVSYEYSNGKKRKLKKEFTADVSERTVPVSETPIVAVKTKKTIMKLPVFLALQVILFALGFIAAERGMVLLWKWKLRREEENSL